MRCPGSQHTQQNLKATALQPAKTLVEDSPTKKPDRDFTEIIGLMEAVKKLPVLKTNKTLPKASGEDLCSS